MEENRPISWRARLAKSNINILSVTPSHWVYEFTYHPKAGVFKWCKTVHEVKLIPRWPDTNPKDLDTTDLVHVPLEKQTYEDIANNILEEVLALRKELEG